MKELVSGRHTDAAVYAAVAVFAMVVTYLLARRPSKMYLVDFVVIDLPDDLKISNDAFMAKSHAASCFTQEALDFQEKILRTSTLTEDTYFPPGIMEPENYDLDAKDLGGGFNLSMEAARREAELVMGGAVEQLLAKTGTSPKAIDCIIVNCSLFCPTPSLTSIVRCVACASLRAVSRTCPGWLVADSLLCWFRPRPPLAHSSHRYPPTACQQVQDAV